MAEAADHDRASLLEENRTVTTTVMASRKTLVVVVGAGALFVSAAAFSLASRSSGALTAMEAGINADVGRLTVDSVYFPVPKSDGSGDFTSITATNEMLSVHGKSGEDYPWMDGLLIEPHFKTTFTADGEVSNWRVVHQDTAAEVSSSEPSDTFVHVFTDLGEYHVKRAPYSDDGQELADETAKVFVKYVRREIRSLSGGSKSRLFNAWGILIDMEDEVKGRDKYGDDFTSMKKLQALHNNFAGAQECDHLHDGMGFLPSHIQMSRLFEASLQSIDSAISLPYWEYTIDVEHIITQKHGNFMHYKDLDVFSEAFFGKTNEDTATIDTGVFAKINVEADPKFSTVVNAWGLIRAPWNTLSAKKPVRYFGAGGESQTEVVSTVLPSSTSMPTCANLHNVLNRSITLLSFSGSIAQQAHGPMHLLTGGVAGTPDFMEFVKGSLQLEVTAPSFPEAWSGVSEFFILVSRALYRYKLLKLPDPMSCGTEMVSEADCVGTCDVKEVFASQAFYDNVFVRMGYTDSITDEKLVLMLEYLCKGGIVYGDHGTSSAPNDPSFYSLHGTVERYLQLQRLKERFTEEPWPHREQCVFSDNIHPFNQRCFGHYTNDELLFGEVDGQTFTNKGYYDYLSPMHSKNTYVYDNFAWPHCDAVGVTIN